MKNIFSYSFFLFPFSFFLLIIITLSFCTTSPQTGTLTGTVNLDGQTDNSGIIIGVYKLAELDPDIVEANQKWPHIGVIINQHTEFDHRFGTLIKTGETDASGYFEIKDIPTGIYNVVAIKDSFGFRYIYNVQINNGNNSLHAPRSTLHASRSSDLTLYPETTISADITTATTFESFHHYIIKQDIIVDDELTIEPGAVVRLNEGVKMTIYGELTAVGQENNFIWFTSNDSLFSLFPSHFSPNTSLFEYNRIELDGTLNKEVSFCKFDHAGTGLLSKVNGFNISDCIFRDSQCGFKAEDVDSAFCSNLLCEDITNDSYGGIYFDHVNDGIIENNIVNDCENGMKIKNNSNNTIINNYIILSNIGIDISYYCNQEIIHNIIERCTTCLKIFSGSFSEVVKNYLQGNTCIGFNTPICSQYNNLKSSTFLFYMYYGTNDTCDCFNNFLYILDDNQIDERIYDKNDVVPSLQPYYGEVEYKPFLTEEYSHAGIIGD